jgi:hypothetical protein
MNWNGYRRFNAVVFAILALVLASPVALRVTAHDGGVRVLDRFEVPDLCLKRRATGVNCSSCGIGRSIVCLLRGELEPSRAFHRGGGWVVAWLCAQLTLRLGLIFASLGGRFAIVDGVTSATTFLLVCFGVTTI